MWYISIEMKKCQIQNCDKKYYAKGFCRSHYANYLRNGNPIPARIINKGSVCKVTGCHQPAKAKKYCNKHYSRILKNGDLEFHYAKGDKNFRWNGGTSEYENSYLMKKNRLIKLKQTKRCCEICNNRGDKIHHTDYSKDNHALNNLLVVCNKCHAILHHRTGNKTSKYIRLYGMTLKQLAKKYGGSESKYCLYHQSGELKEFLKLKNESNPSIKRPGEQTTDN